MIDQKPGGDTLITCTSHSLLSQLPGKSRSQPGEMMALPSSSERNEEEEEEEEGAEDESQTCVLIPAWHQRTLHKAGGRQRSAGSNW